MMKNETLTITIANEEAMLELGQKLSKTYLESDKKSAIIFLYGNLGAGKTTLVRGFLRGLSLKGPVKSPTYTIVEPYQFENFSVFHFDFYRLKHVDELEFIGIQDYFSANAICLIEWPENGSGLLPLPDLACHIDLLKEGRRIKFVAYSEFGKKIINQMK